MKQFILPLIALLVLGSANAQIVYESPHVKDGKTIQFTMPTGYFEVANTNFVESEMFATQKGLDLNEQNIEALPIGIISVIHVPNVEQTLDSFKDDLVEGLINPNDGIVVIGQPDIVEVNEHDCLYAAFKGEMEGKPFGGIYFSVVEFGDYFIVISYYAFQEINDVLDYEEFKKIMTTYNEIATTKEDEMHKAEDLYLTEVEDEMYFEEDETNYINDLFETMIHAYDILPDYGENWDMPIEENSHLLSEFVFKKEHGTIKVFSGGQSSNYPTNKEKAEAIQSAMELPTRLSLKKETEFSNEDHFFQLYTISGGGTMTSVYTTLVNNELVFFVIDGGSTPSPDFKPAVRDFMLTMWVDYYDKVELAPED